MDFYQKYELIDPLPGEGTKSFRARQISSGRDVAVHLLTGGKNPENDALLARLRTLPPESLRKLLEVGDNDGVTFVATEAPPYLHLGEWLGEQERAAGASDAAKFTHAGAWKVPVMTAPPPPPPSSAPGAGSSGPGEFTLMFQKAAAKEKGDPMPAAAPPPPAPAFPAVSSPASTQVLPQAPVPPAAQVSPQAAAPADGPGEFTRMFQAAQANPPQPAGTMQVPAQGGTPIAGTHAVLGAMPLGQAMPGGTFAMQAAMPPAGSAAPGSSQPGEFTSMFNAPAGAPVSEPVVPKAPAAAAPQAVPPPSAPGSFTSMFSAPPCAPVGEPEIPKAPAATPVAEPDVPRAPAAAPGCTASSCRAVVRTWELHEHVQCSAFGACWGAGGSESVCAAGCTAASCAVILRARELHEHVQRAAFCASWRAGCSRKRLRLHRRRNPRRLKLCRRRPRLGASRACSACRLLC